MINTICRVAVCTSVVPVFLVAVLAVMLTGCGESHISDNRQVPGRGENPDAVDGNILKDEPAMQSAPLPAGAGRDITPRELRETDWFATVADALPHVYSDGGESGFYTLLETVGGGVAMLDYDQDGDLDLFFTGGGEIKGEPVEITGKPSILYRNDGDWKFFDVTSEMGISAPGFYTHGAFVADYDNDGYPDIFVTGYQGCRLLHNNGGKSFTDVTSKAGIEIKSWATAAAWGDFDKDGHVDLYVASYADWRPDPNRRCKQSTPDGRSMREPCAPTGFPGSPDYVWRNRGDGTFEDVTKKMNITAKHRGLGALANDFDGDGWCDIYVANDANENDLYFGGPEGFTSQGVLAGVALSPQGVPEGSMGVDTGDVDGDGKLDLFYTNFLGDDNTLVRQVDARLFVNAADGFKITGASRRWVGFGAAIADFDGDAWNDIIIANGNVFYGSTNSPYYEPPQLFKNQGGKTFQDVSQQGGPYFSVDRAGRGLAVGDLDNNGTLDVVVAHQNEQPALLRNQTSAGNWFRVELQGRKSGSDAIGAKVSSMHDGREIVRWVSSGRSYLSSLDRRILFPAGDSNSVKVIWPQGATEVFSNLEAKKNHVLVEGEGESQK